MSRDLLIRVRVDDSERRLLQAEADRIGESMSVVVRAAIRTYLANHPERWDNHIQEQP